MGLSVRCRLATYIFWPLLSGQCYDHYFEILAFLLKTNVVIVFVRNWCILSQIRR
jgi:hypothetical protein